jgi:hypothetical protein
MAAANDPTAVSVGLMELPFKESFGMQLVRARDLPPTKPAQSTDRVDQSLTQSNGPAEVPENLFKVAKTGLAPGHLCFVLQICVGKNAF